MSEQDINVLYILEKIVYCQCYIMALNESCHSSDHIHVTILSIPAEEMADIWNKCVVGSSTNCEISKKTINKNNR